MAPGSHTRHHFLLHAGLAAAWIVVVAWLAFEHRGVDAAARETLLNRARDISNTIALVSRTSQRGMLVRQGRIQDALDELVQYQQVHSVALLNSTGDVVVAAGEPLDLQTKELPKQGTRWEEGKVTIINLVDFGQPSMTDGSTRPPTIVLPDRSENDVRRGDNPTSRGAMFQMRPDGMPPSPQGTGPERIDAPPPPPLDPRGEPGARREDSPTSRTFAFRGERNERDGRRDGRTVFSRPFWMSEQEYEQLLAKQGLHGFVLVLSTQAMQEELRRDLWLRALIAGVALIAVIGIGVGWNSRERSTLLQMRLVRSHEMNEHLRELNVAAAGLAHETRNPLSIVRGVAQMIDKEEKLPEDTRVRAQQIIDEVDLVTDRLNEFIKYSRPTEPRPAPTNLRGVVRNVESVLESDREDKNATIEIQGPELMIQADESLLRQVVFNLMLNALQSIGTGGKVRAVVADAGRGEASLVIEDDGPGVPVDVRNEIFRPYFTTREQGSGLGLAVVRQIVLAHHWEIDCETSALGGAAFRLRGMQILKGHEGAAHDS